MSNIQILSLIVLVVFIVFVGTINIFLINMAPKYKIKLSRWIAIPLIISLWMETKDRYLNSILPLFFLLFFTFEVILVVSDGIFFHELRFRHLIRLSRRFLNFLLLIWYIMFFIMNLIFKD